MTVFSCPICSEKLNAHDRVFRCAKNHTFDVAKEGYVNLLTVNRKRSQAPGDNAEMIAARRRFLGADYYKPLADALQNVVGCPHRLADLGCGEGYFTQALSQVAQEVYGLDISKVAAKAASKKVDSQFIVASIMQLPFLSEVFDVVTVIMAPSSPEILRVLKQGGVFCRVLPGEDHFVQLRQLAYQTLRGNRQPKMQLDNFSLLRESKVTFELNLNNQAILDLVAMTPMQFKTTQDFHNQIAKLEHLTVTADFRIDLFKKD